VISPVFVPELDPERLEPAMPAVQAKAPVEFVIVHPVDPDPPPIKMLPVELLLIFNTPVDPPSRDSALAPVEESEPPAANVRAVPEVEIVSIDVTPVRAPPVVILSPPFDVSANVPEEFPIEVFPDALELRLIVGAVIAAVPDESV
jgi:hypothetical protein